MQRKHFKLGTLSLKVSRCAIFSFAFTVVLTALLAVEEHRFWHVPLEEQWLEQRIDFSVGLTAFMEEFTYAVCDWYMLMAVGFIFLAWGIATIVGLFMGTDINE
ncbi:MAG: hypothetical protein KBT05_06510 [Bacteroidales bacterium]|nr:hypothetical protein [Candidatus Cryptobacteroides caccocaballi]